MNSKDQPTQSDIKPDGGMRRNLTADPEDDTEGHMPFKSWSDRNLKADVEPVTDTDAAETTTDGTETADAETATAQAPAPR